MCRSITVAIPTKRELKYSPIINTSHELPIIAVTIPTKRELKPDELIFLAIRSLVLQWPSRRKGNWNYSSSWKLVALSITIAMIIPTKRELKPEPMYIWFTHNSIHIAGPSRRKGNWNFNHCARSVSDKNIAGTIPTKRELKHRPWPETRLRLIRLQWPSRPKGNWNRRWRF